MAGLVGGDSAAAGAYPVGISAQRNNQVGNILPTIYTQATLPLATNYTTGTLAYCSDTFWQYCNGTSWATLGSSAGPTFAAVVPPSGDSTGATDYATITAAITASVAAGGSIIYFQPGNYYINQGLNLAAGVELIGSGWQYASNLGTLSGTVFIATAAIAMLSSNATDLGSPYGSSAALQNSLIKAPSVRDLSLNGNNLATYGIKCGALYQGGPSYGFFSNLFITNCTGLAANADPILESWGIYFENIAHTTIERTAVYNCSHGIALVCSGQSLYTFGNMEMRGVISSQNTSHGKGRNYWVVSRQSSSTNNVIMIDLGGSGSAYSGSTQACTMSNGSTSIAITDTSKFAIGMPVSFSGSVNGFSTGITYFVLTVSAQSGAGTITVCSSMAGTGAQTAIPATGSTAVNCSVTGFANMEFGGRDVSSNLTYSSLTGATDNEAAGGAGAVFQNCTGFNAEFGVAHTGTSIADIVMRNCVSQTMKVRCSQSMTADLDSTSQKSLFEGYLPSFNNTFYGPAYFGSGQIFLQGKTTPDIISNGNFGNAIQIQNQTFAMLHSQVATGATIANGGGNNITFTTSAGGSVVLPNLSSVNYAGWEIRLLNPQANAITVTSATGSIIGKGTSVAGTTGVTVAANTSAVFIASNNAGTMNWCQIV